MICTARQLGKPVVTANKALLSAHGETLRCRPPIQSEPRLRGECGGGIPMTRAERREGFIEPRILRLYGIVNRTCNYIRRA